MTSDSVPVRMALLRRELTPAQAAEQLGMSEADAQAWYAHMTGEQWMPSAPLLTPGGTGEAREAMPETAEAAAVRLSAGALRQGFALTALHEYRNREGQPKFWRIRCKHPDSGEKWIRPMRRNGHGYELKEPPAPRGKLLYRPPTPVAGGQTIWVVEGEACADELALLGAEVYTSGSADSACAADWTPLTMRPGFVRIWPDNDAAGAHYEKEAVKRLRAAGCAVDIVDVAALELPVGGDCVDWLAAHPGATLDDVQALPLVRLRPTHGGGEGLLGTMPAARRANRREKDAATGGSILQDAPEHVPEGGRNSALLQLAGRLRRAGLDQRAIFAALRAHNSDHCEPPLPEHEVEAIAQWVAKHLAGNGLVTPAHVEWPPVSVPDELPSAREHFLHPLLPRREVTLLYGAGGSGKSYLALEWAAHLAAGIPWAGLPRSPPARVLFVSMEDDAQTLAFRIHHVLHDYEHLAAGEREFSPECVLTPLAHVEGVRERLILLDASDSPPIVQETSEQGVRKLVPTAAFDTLRDSIAEYRPNVVVIDNASDAFAGDENSRMQVRAFLHLLKHAMRDADCPDAAVLLLAHVNKGGTYSGSTAWNNTCRSRLVLEETESGIWLRQEKVNHAMRADPIALVRREGLLLPATGAEGRRGQEADERAVLAAVRAAQAKGLSVPASPRTPHHCSAQAVLVGLPGLDALPAALASKEGRSRFWRAVRALIASGELLERVIKTRGRKERVSLVCGAVQAESGA